ncbi:hypothetical protein [Brevibacillus daliensis]|nr:hypothetical protein [Brevibacillus daliensis]
MNAIPKIKNQWTEQLHVMTKRDIEEKHPSLLAIFSASELLEKEKMDNL